MPETKASKLTFNGACPIFGETFNLTDMVEEVSDETLLPPVVGVCACACVGVCVCVCVGVGVGVRTAHAEHGPPQSVPVSL